VIQLKLSPKAVRFLIEALDMQIQAFEVAAQKGVSEDEASDFGNDVRFLQAVRVSLVNSLKSD
jgi:hypothetical protein